MRMVHALGWYFPESLGGTEVYVSALARRLADAGHEVLVAAPDPDGSDERRYRHEGVEVYRYPVGRVASRAQAQGAEALPGAERLRAHLDRLRPELVHFHTLAPGLGMHEMRAARRAGTRIFFTSHESRLGHLCQRGTLMRWGEAPCDGLAARAKCAACVLDQRGLPRPLAWAAALLPSPAARAARRLPGRLATALSMSELIAENLRMQAELCALAERLVLLTRAALEIVAANGAPRDKLVLNRVGIGHPPTPAAERAGGRRPLRLGYVGRFDPVKGVEVLAQAIALLPRDLPIEVELRGPEGGAMERAVRSRVRELLAGDPRVTLGGPVPADEIPTILAGYDILCCPSICLEGGPLVALEAHAAGTPVVGSRIGGLAELITNANGCLVPPGDAAALAAAIRAIAADPTATVARWRRALTPPRTMDDVARDTLAMYQA
jgi:glycosyltransferase involved in cell wall biosynthesis